jgi:hypothetical protein
MAKIVRHSQGLGDTILKITTATGIKKLVDDSAKAKGQEQCTPCEERRKMLNNPELLVNKIFYNKQ